MALTLVNLVDLIVNDHICKRISLNDKASTLKSWNIQNVLHQEILYSRASVKSQDKIKSCLEAWSSTENLRVFIFVPNYF